MNGFFAHMWPMAGSAYASRVDWMVMTFTGVMLLFVVPVVVCLVVFTWRYREGREAVRDSTAIGNHKLEIAWIVIPFIAAMILFGLSARLFFEARTPPVDALEIQLTGKQWMWKFQHASGQRELNALHVPAGRPIKLNMISEDVIHSFYIPVMRVKQDVLPGRYTQMWFQADQPGTYQVYCAEFCGTDHSAMLAKLVVQTPADYTRWLGVADAPGSLAEQGEALYQQMGCSGCHGPSAAVHAPKLEGLYGRPVPLADGSVVTADASYLRDSILLPQKQVAAGYAPIMPTYSNVLDEDAVVRLVAYIQSLGNTEPPR
ncbi:cytochrome c oxidase subunit II [Pseudomonas japonica]|uniref:cytochrome c oxidase subunit II n=1 Tax=Pseudomonas japonica TaxID=256466 RepID=UPI00280C2B00|nr:cytochrome c oxidase subunit II [Pseudomonas japonica]